MRGGAVLQTLGAYALLVACGLGLLAVLTFWGYGWRYTVRFFTP